LGVPSIRVYVLSTLKRLSPHLGALSALNVVLRSWLGREEWLRSE